MKNTRFAAATLSATISAALCAALCITMGSMTAAPAWAQAASSTAATATAPAKIHGHAQDPLYQPIANAKVEVTTDAKTALYTFTTNESGDYAGTGIKPGTYVVLLHGEIKGADGKPTQGTIDFQKDVKFAAGADVQVDFDLSRAAYVSTLPKEVQAKIVEMRKQNASAMQQNSGIKNANKLINDARAARTAGDFEKAVALDTQAAQAKPDVGLTWYELGTSDLGAKKYDDAVTNLKKALVLMQAEKSPNQDMIAATNNNLGEALAKSGKVNDAVAAYEAAAKADPTKAGMYYGNEAIVLFKTGQGDAAGVAADKAIAADPSKPIPYYIKGWAMVQHATIDPKTNKIILPPGCAEAYQKFLSMQPTGPLADDAKSILAQSGETVQKSFHKR